MKEINEEIQRRREQKKNRKYARWSNLIMKIILLAAVLFALKQLSSDRESVFNHVIQQETGGR